MQISAPPGQLYECRDCPARCCRVPWSIRLRPDESERYTAEAFVRERVGAEALRVLGTGVLPMREHDRRLQCVFLDDDQLCSLQKRFGHPYIPRSCQAFPFGFLRNEDDVVVAQLSQLCPSIRDNYGRPVAKQLKPKLQEAGGPERMSTVLATRSRLTLSQPQYLQFVRRWESELDKDVPVTSTLAALYDWTDQVERALPAGSERVPDEAIREAIAGAPALSSEPLAGAARPSFQARVMFSYLLGNLCYPSRVRQAHRVGPAPWHQGLASLFNKLAWMRGRGVVDMLFMPAPFPLQRVRRIPRFLDRPEGALVRDYLRTVLQRRRLFSRPEYVMSALVDLSLGAVLVSHVARCRAAAQDRGAVQPEDVREAISVAELVLLNHVMASEQGKTIKKLRVQLLADRTKLRAMLASEAPGITRLSVERQLREGSPEQSQTNDSSCAT